MSPKSSAFVGLDLDARWVRELPADASEMGGSRQVFGALHSFVAPTPVPAPRLRAMNRTLAHTLGFSDADLATPALVAAMAGNAPLNDFLPYASNYGGHQFGHWAGQLGDGRAIVIGELIDRTGARQELQLKGAGPTPYSRHADGRAVLRSSLREYVCSEAMHALGVPTTRALSLVTTGAQVVRDLLYSGEPKPEPGAIVCRVAPSFTRFGHFELPASRGDHALLNALVEFTIARDFPALLGHGDTRLIDWLCEIAERTARLMVEWLRVGFVHGVMNTDNLSILGLTIDYGPYGWLDAYDPNWTPNLTDAEGKRYAFARQPEIAHWNLTRLVGAIAPLIDDRALLDTPIKRYVETFNRAYPDMLAAKLGLRHADADALTLSRELHGLMSAHETDYTTLYRALAAFDGTDFSTIDAAFYSAPPERIRGQWNDWLMRYAARRRAEAEPDFDRRAAMNRVNPFIVPRNFLAQEAIDASTRGDDTMLHALLDALAAPYDDSAATRPFARLRPEWARARPGCSMLSCSS
jgi:serine/tyrosine/threonine adenylyltransferase